MRSAPTTAAISTALAGIRFGVQLRPQPRAGDRAVAAEREQSSARCWSSQAIEQKNWPMVEMQQHDAVPSRSSSAWLKMAATPPPPAVTASVVLRGEQERQQQDPAADRRVEDRLPDALGRRVGGALGLLRHVRGGVEAGDRVLREQEAQRQRRRNQYEAAVRRRSRSC